MLLKLNIVAIAVLQGIALQGCGGSVVTVPTQSGDSGYVQDSSIDGSAGAPSDSSTEESAASNNCPGTGGPTMVQLPQGYCIDSTEVTRAQYAEWLATNPSVADQGSDCAWNTTFTPDNTPWVDASCEHVWPPEEKGDYPVVCVDWCDANYYCKGVGKRLCGKIGGGTNADADYADAKKSQWFNACSSGGVNNYCYGGNPSIGEYDGFDASRCSQTISAVGQAPGCTSTVTGFTGVFDLNGNVYEWEDSCKPHHEKPYEPRMFSCHIRGGMSPGDAIYQRCSIGSQVSRSASGVWIGFRCCS